MQLVAFGMSGAIVLAVGVSEACARRRAGAEAGLKGAAAPPAATTPGSVECIK